MTSVSISYILKVSLFFLFPTDRSKTLWQFSFVCASWFFPHRSVFLTVALPWYHLLYFFIGVIIIIIIIKSNKGWNITECQDFQTQYRKNKFYEKDFWYKKDSVHNNISYLWNIARNYLSVQVSILLKSILDRDRNIDISRMLHVARVPLSIS